MNKGGKREGSGRKAIQGKEVKVKIPFEIIGKIEKEFAGDTLSEKIRIGIDNALSNKSNYKKFRVIDLFCGCGGISEGFQQNKRFEIVGAIDFNKIACTTYKYNFSKANVICGDITEIDVKDTGFDEIDIIVGGPPCQGFSALNRQQKLEDDPRNKLFFQFLRFVKELKPKAIMIENVRQILTQKDGYARKQICSLLEEMGYNVDYKILDASDYGVPQKRMRAVFVGIRNDVGKVDFKKISKYKVTKKATVDEALKDLYPLERLMSEDSTNEFYILNNDITNSYLKQIHNETNYIFNHRINYPNKNVQKRISYVPPGGNWKNIPEKLFPSYRNNRHSNYMRRLDSNGQSITIDTGHAVYFHPVFNRVPTVRESARIQSFPDRFIFLGNKSEQLRQVGNAVPPLLAKAISSMILEVLDNEE
jgi:DNA (cytosine-5)-methyltransferase 1